MSYMHNIIYTTFLSRGGYVYIYIYVCTHISIFDMYYLNAYTCIVYRHTYNIMNYESWNHLKLSGVPWLPDGFWRCRLWSAGSPRCPRATHASCPSRSAGSILARRHWHGAIQGTCHRAWGAAGIVPYPAVFKKENRRVCLDVCVVRNRK